MKARADTIGADETISRVSAMAETDFTVMSMPSLVYAWFYLFCICFLFLLLQVFPVLCKIVIIVISCACSSVLEKE